MKFVLSVLLAFFAACSAELMEQHSFQPPFTTVDNSGTRLPSGHFRIAGTTVVNNNFIRLTPDRQSKKGAIWSRKSLGTSVFTTVLKFRISGQGKLFFGDGIGFWLVQQGYYNEGNLHGFQERYTGVGVVIDTFKNTENLASHRDVTVLINDGQQTYESMTKEVKGCNAVLRYHADRADFSVTDSSRAKIIVNGTSLQIFIDAKSSGEWMPCVDIPNTGLPADWARTAHVGITATTGQLADNHDIISMKLYSDSAISADSFEEEEANKPLFELPANANDAEKLKSLETALNDLLKQYETHDHAVEHEFASVSDDIKNLIGKLEKREDNAESRIGDIEEEIKKVVEGSLNERLNNLERYVREQADLRLEEIEKAIDDRIREIQANVKTNNDANRQVARSWQLPFAFLLIIFTAAGIGLYLFYAKLRKMHIL